MHHSLVPVAAGRNEVQVTGALIIGAGPAGCSAAITLASAGTPTLLLERSRETGDALCGGFLSWQSLARLRELGIDPTLLGGQPVDRVRLFHRHGMAEAQLPMPGLGLSRHMLDTALLDAACRAGAGVERGVRITAVDSSGASGGDGADFAGRPVFLATGKSGLTGHPRSPPPPAETDPVVGLRLRLAPGPGHARLTGSAVELFLFDRGYAGLVLQEDGSANLCLAVHKSRFIEAEGKADRLIADWASDCPPLSDRLAAAMSGPATLPRADAIAAIPYGWMAGAGAAPPWRIGDQLACIPSLAGEGMGIALWSGMAAARFSLRGDEVNNWHRHASVQLRRPMHFAQWAWRMAEDTRRAGIGIALSRQAPWLIRAIARLTRVPA